MSACFERSAQERLRASNEIVDFLERERRRSARIRCAARWLRPLSLVLGALADHFV